jgi:hypothetical protein
MPLWKCIFRLVFNVVAAQQLEGNRHLQDCRTIALSVEANASLLLFRGDMSVIHSCHS